MERKHDINEIYKQLRNDLKLDDTVKFHEKMRGYIPEYEKLPRIKHKKSLSPTRIEDELEAAAKGVPKNFQFMQLQEMLKKKKEEELQVRVKLRDVSRSQRKQVTEDRQKSV